MGLNKNVDLDRNQILYVCEDALAQVTLCSGCLSWKRRRHDPGAFPKSGWPEMTAEKEVDSFSFIVQQEMLNAGRWSSFSLLALMWESLPRRGPIPVRSNQWTYTKSTRIAPADHQCGTDCSRDALLRLVLGSSLPRGSFTICPC